MDQTYLILEDGDREQDEMYRVIMNSVREQSLISYLDEVPFIQYAQVPISDQDRFKDLNLENVYVGYVGHIGTKKPKRKLHLVSR